MKPAFLDSSGLIAVWDEDDQWHEGAMIAYQALAEFRAPVLTTSYVLLECGNAAARRPYRMSVVRLRDRLEARGLLIHPTLADWQNAWSSYHRGEAGRAGIVDQVSFVVMRRLGLRNAFTNDQHFRAAGFEPMF